MDSQETTTTYLRGSLFVSGADDLSQRHGETASQQLSSNLQHTLDERLL
jgi:hypothetical protein